MGKKLGAFVFTVRIFAAGALLSAALAPICQMSAAVDENIPAKLDEADAQFRKERKLLVEESLALTPEEAVKFWPIYEKLEEDITRLTQRRRAIISGFGENYDNMTDETAKQLLIERLDYHEARIRTMKAFIPRFEKALSGRKLARYYQIESKISAAVEAGIAEELPLVK